MGSEGESRRRTARRVALVAMFALCAPRPLVAGDDRGAGAATDEGKLSLFPALFYTPETSMVMGAMAMYAFRSPGADPGARRSGVPVFAAYTLKNQFIAATRPNVYFGGERWNAEGVFEAAYFPDTVFPDGPRTRDDDGEKFTSRRVIFEPQLTRLVWRSLRIGARGTWNPATAAELGDLCGAGCRWQGLRFGSQRPGLSGPCRMPKWPVLAAQRIDV